MKILVIGFILSAGFFMAPASVVAQNGICEGNDKPTKDNPCIEKDLNLADRSLIVNAINLLLGLAGGLAVLFLIIGGIRYTTAGDDREGTDHARRIIRGAITGVILILLSLVIVNVIDLAVRRGTVG